MGGLCSKDDDSKPQGQQGREGAKNKGTRKANKYASAQDEEEVSGAAAAAPPAVETRKPAASSRHTPNPNLLPSELISKQFLQCPGLTDHGDQLLACAAVAPTTSGSIHASSSSENPTTTTSKNQNLLLVGCEDSNLQCVDVAEGTVVKTWKKAHRKDINRIWAPHPETGIFFTSSRDTLVKGWKLDSDESVATFEGHSLNVTTITSNPTGDLLCSGSRDNSVRLWDIATQQCLSVQDIKLNIVHFCRWIPALNCIAQGGEDLTVRIWDTRTGSNGFPQLELNETLANFDYHPICSALVGDPMSSVSLYTGHNGFNGQGAMITEWDLRMKKQVRHFQGHRGTVRWLRELQGGTKLLSCSDDGSLRIWNLASGGLDATIHFPEGGVTCVDSLVASSDKEETLTFTCRTGVVVCGQMNDTGDQLIRTRYFGKAGEP